MQNLKFSLYRPSLLYEPIVEPIACVRTYTSARTAAADAVYCFLIFSLINIGGNVDRQ